MPLKDDIKTLIKCYNDNKSYLEHNKKLFDIYEGDLLKYVLQDLREQLSDKSYDSIRHRVAPINILKRLIDKLSQIYSNSPIRKLEGSTQQKDQDLLAFYEKAYKMNTRMQQGNEFFNLWKNTFIEPYLYEGMPHLRNIPSDRFLVFSNDPVNPMNVTHYLKVMGTYTDRASGEKRTIIYLYTDTEFLIVNDKEDILHDQMNQYGLDGTNPYGRIPGVYISRSVQSLIPPIDSDTLTMTKIFPVLVSDLNYAVMFQSFSIMYGIDLDEENLKMAPNAFWRFKTDPNKPDSKPSVGVIKPEVDVDKVLNFISTQLAFWLNSRNIRPGTIGALTTSNFASGFSKIIDEMDTCEDREKQVPYFIDGEAALFDLTINNMHPLWLRDPDFKNKVAWSKGVSVITEFQKQRPVLNPSVVLADGVIKINNSLASRGMVLKELYPDATGDQIDAILKEIDDERTVNVPAVVPPPPTGVITAPPAKPIAQNEPK